MAEISLTRESEELEQVKVGTAALVYCLVQTIAEMDSSFQARFLDRLKRIENDMSAVEDGGGLHESELFSFTRDLIENKRFG